MRELQKQASISMIFSNLTLLNMSIPFLLSILLTPLKVTLTTLQSYTHRGILTEFLPAGTRFCRLLLGVISRLARSQLLVVAARGILGIPAWAKALADP